MSRKNTAEAVFSILWALLLLNLLLFWVTHAKIFAAGVVLLALPTAIAWFFRGPSYDFFD